MSSPVLVDPKDAGPNDAFSIGYHGVEFSKLDKDTNHAQSNFAQGYQDLYDVLSTQVKFNSGDPRMFWLQNAVEINSNNAMTNPSDPTGLSNTWIRSITASGLLYDGTASFSNVNAIVQRNSDTIGKYVLGAIDGYPRGDTSNPRDLSQVGTILGFNDFIQKDIGSALREGGQSIQGWGGSLFYWNTPMSDDNPSTTIGSQIGSNSGAFGEFIAINAKGIWDTFGADVSNTLGGYNPIENIVSELNSLGALMGAQAPWQVERQVIWRFIQHAVGYSWDGVYHGVSSWAGDTVAPKSNGLKSLAATASSTSSSSNVQLLNTTSGIENSNILLNVLPGAPNGATASDTLISTGTDAPTAFNGAVSVVNGKLSYTPKKDFVGTDYVTFTTFNGTGYTAWVVPVNVGGIAHDTVTQNADGSTTTLHFDATGTASSARTARSDGSYDLTTYSVTGGQSYASSTQKFTAQGVLISTTSFYVDGSVYQKSVPIKNADGSTGTNVYDKSGTLVQQSIVKTDGTKQVTTNLGTAKPYTTIKSFYNAAGRLTSEVYFNSDGSVYQNGSVLLNANGSSVETFTTSSNNVLGRKISNVDGTSDVSRSGIFHQPWVSTSCHYDASGHLVSKQLLRSDGSIYLQGNAASGPLGTTITYASTGSLKASEVIYTDGSGTITVSGISGQTYVSKSSAYDPAGNLTTETFGNSDGSQDANHYLNNAAGSPYIASIIHYTSAGLLQSETDLNPDGSVSGSQQTTVSADGSTTTTSKGPNGNVISTTVSNAGVATKTTYDSTGATAWVQVSVGPMASYTGSANGLFVSTQRNSTVTLTGSLNQIDGSGSGATLNLGGQNETVYLNGATVNLWNNASATVTGNGDSVVLNNNDTVTVSGTGDTATIQGIGDSLAIGSAKVNVFNNAGGTITGDGNNVAVYNAANITISGANDTATFYGQNSSVIMAGTGTDVEVGSTGEKITMTSGTVHFWNGTSATVTGSGNNLVLNNNDTVTVSGAGVTATIQGTGDSLAIGSATVNVFNNAAATITGDGNNVAVYNGANIAVNGAGDTATLYGQNSSVTMNGTGAVVEVGSTGEKITMTSGTVHFWNGTSATVAGNGDSVVLNNSDTATVSGTGATATIQGTGDSLAIGSGRISLTKNAAGTVTGNGNTISLFDGSALTAAGTNDTFVFSATPSTATVAGYDASDTLQFSSSTFATWHDLLTHASQQGTSTVIQTDPSHSVTLTGVALSSLKQSQFRFV